MKATGVIRNTDGLGRLVLPIEIRRRFGINEGDGLEIFVDEDNIILRKYAPGCDACGNAGVKLIPIGQVQLCPDCIAKASQGA